MAETVLYEAAEGVATLTLNRPDRLNTIGPELIDDLRAMLERAWTDAEVRAIRLRGAGRAFESLRDALARRFASIRKKRGFSICSQLER